MRAPAVRNAGTAGLGISSTGAAGTSCTALNSGASTVLVTAARVADSETLPVTGVVAFTAFAAAGGYLVLAGILERQADELKEAYAPWLPLEVADTEDGWILMTARR